jgi:hypothetical protein
VWDATARAAGRRRDFDSTQGTTGNPIIFTCEGGNTAANYFLSDTEYSRLPVPPNFLNRGYIEFELDTVLTAANNSTVIQQHN